MGGAQLYSGVVHLPSHTTLYTIADHFGLHVVEATPLPHYMVSPPLSNSFDQKEWDFFNFKGRIGYMVNVNDKIKEIKRYISNESEIQAGQVAALMDMLMVENHKMEVAKFAFPYIKDRAGFSVITDAFILESSKQEFLDWIKEQ